MSHIIGIDVSKATLDCAYLRDPDDVEITLVVMSPVTADLLKSYRDLGVHWCNIGVGMENWNKPDIMMPMIEEFSRLIPEL